MKTTLDKQFNATEVVGDIAESVANGKQFQNSIGLPQTSKDCIDFYEGRQWGKVSNKTRTLPRATFNMSEMITDSKVAGILATPLKAVFLSSANEEAAKKLTAFHEAIEKEIEADDLYEQVVLSAAVEGSSFIHFFWDADAVGKRGEYKGGMRAERLDMLAVTVNDPTEQKIQRQKWVIIESRADVESVKDMCEFADQKELIKADAPETKNGGDVIEQEESHLVTVYTRYFRVDGEVYFEKATKNALITKAHPINPTLNKEIAHRVVTETMQTERSQTAKNGTERTVADADTTLQDEVVKVPEHQYKASLYPIEVYQYKARRDSIYGRGEVEAIIPNNRTINFNAAMMSKAVEDLGFGTIVAKESALGVGGSRISNDPTKILIDKYRGNGQGFYTLNKQPFNVGTYQLNENIMATTRAVTGSTEVMTGEVLGKNQSGTSIFYLQQQAQKPIDKLAKRYKKFRERVAMVEMQYYILFYENKEYETEISKDELKMQAMTEMQNGQISEEDMMQMDFSKPEKVRDTFNGKDFENEDFDIKVQLGAATEYSEIAVLQMLDNLLQAKYIDLNTYLGLYPERLLPNKEDLEERLKEQEESQVNTLSAQVQDLTAKMERAQTIIKNQAEIVNNITSTIQENARLKALLAQLQAEYTAKINVANNDIIAEQGAAQAMADMIHAGNAQKSQNIPQE